MSHALEKYLQLGSVLFLSVFVPLLAYITESLFSTNNYIILVILALNLSGLFTLAALFLGPFIFSWASELLENGARAPENLIKFARTSWNLKFKRGADFSERLKYQNLHRNFFLIGAAINFFLGSGFFVAYYFASVFPEYRLTIAQLSIVIHGIGTLLQTIIAEPRIAIIMDDSGREDWRYAVESFILGKGAAFFIIAFVFLVIMNISI